MSLLGHCPRPPDWRLPWDAMRAEYDWLDALYACPQDPVHHAEGDVGTHTRMVCEELIALPAWRALDLEERRTLFAAAVLHDVAKPACTKHEDGRITSRGHSRRGAVMARNILWRMNVPFAQREAVCGLIRLHQVPYWLIERPDARRVAVEVSWVTRGDRLAILAEADVRGRICDDKQRLLDNVGLFAEQLAEMGCLTHPYPFANDHARVLFFADASRIPEAPAHEAYRCDVIVLSGLPGSGKDHYIRHHLADWEVIGLDDVRAELGVSPADGQGEVVNVARERARRALREGRRFVWNATNLSRQLRRMTLDLLLSYQARVTIVYREVPPEVQAAQNRGRERRVPEAVIGRMLEQWEVPDLTEAHAVRG
jgi:predicted kinase